MGTASECLGATHLSLHTCWSLLWQQLGREKMEIVRTQTVSSIDRKEVLKLTLFWVHSLDTILSSSIFLWNSKAKLQVQKTEVLCDVQLCQVSTAKKSSTRESSSTCRAPPCSVVGGRDTPSASTPLLPVPALKMQQLHQPPRVLLLPFWLCLWLQCNANKC